MPPPDSSQRHRTVHARRALVDGALHDDVVIEIDGDRIRSLGRFDNSDRNRRIHALVSPGLIDLQCNGFGTYPVIGATEDSLAALQRALAAAGTTAFLPTITTCPSSVRRETHATVMAAAKANAPSSSRILGIHLEGPFLGRRPGAHDPKTIAAGHGDVDAVIDLCSEGVRMMTIAAESPVAQSVVESLVAKGIVVSIGHSAPTREEYQRTVTAGAIACTHIFNSMSGIEHRGFGLAGAILDDPAMHAGLIGDLVHVGAETVRLVFRSKGATRTFLVSDSVAATDGVVVTNAARLVDGTLAGAAKPLAEQVRCIVKSAGVPLVDALVSATATPAKMIGAREMGSIAVGQLADLTCFDEELEVELTYVAGVPVERFS
ncbi:MAG: N-acetylglucosamine-6-phosphate deacetylase [Actinobacteria bacterium]|nr:N-acetylglucosamine-6-phosphate deacetylase [Actinomycetota bacterium]NBP53306.1 N-acetylglucosamine-6-phosphate deacetylase [Actinomycetota bacterium]